MFVIVCVQVMIFFVLYKIWRHDQVKNKEGIEIQGKRIDYKEIPGRPTRYLILAGYQIDGENRKKRIITADRAACKFVKEEDITLIYVHSLDKIYWADEKKHANMPIIILLVLLSVLMWGFMVVGIIYEWM